MSVLLATPKLCSQFQYVLENLFSSSETIPNNKKNHCFIQSFYKGPKVGLQLSYKNTEFTYSSSLYMFLCLLQHNL